MDFKCLKAKEWKEFLRKNTLTEGRGRQFLLLVEGIALRVLKIFKKVIKSKALYFAIALLIQLTILFVLINEMVFNHSF